MTGKRFGIFSSRPFLVVGPGHKQTHNIFATPKATTQWISLKGAPACVRPTKGPYFALEASFQHNTRCPVYILNAFYGYCSVVDIFFSTADAFCSDVAFHLMKKFVPSNMVFGNKVMSSIFQFISYHC